MYLPILVFMTIYFFSGLFAIMNILKHILWNTSFFKVFIYLKYVLF